MHKKGLYTIGITTIIVVWMILFVSIQDAGYIETKLEHIPEKKEVAQKKPCDGWIVFRSDFSKEKNDLIQKSFEFSGCDRNFVELLDCENDSWELDRQNDEGADAWGICQMHRRWQKNIVDDPMFFIDDGFQIKNCYEKYINGTPFSCLDKNRKAYSTGRLIFSK